MIKRHYQISAALFLAGDLVATVASFLAAYYLRFHTGWVPVTKGIPEISNYLQLLPLLGVIWPLTFYFHGLYQIRRGRSLIDEVLAIFVSISLATVLMSGILGFYRTFTYSRAALVIFLGLNLSSVIVTRWIIRRSLERVRARGHNIRRILVVGAGDLGKSLVDRILEHRELGFAIVGFLDDDPGKAETSFRGVPVLGKLTDASAVLAETGADQVYIALPLDAHRKMLQLLKAIGQELVEIKLVPDIMQYITIKAGVEDLDGIPIINLSQVPLQGWMSLVKRSVDLVLATASLVVFAIFILPVAALLIWLEDRGPIFYTQERMGLDGKPFQMYKFRSMRAGAEHATGPVWATKDDPRRTRIGRLLRRFSIDELPQIFNVLRGEMSLVGPRPERPKFVQEFKERIPQYMLRHKVKSGITGWAQVHGWRGNTSIKKRFEYDLYYIENWSLALDVKILWLTVKRSLWDTNAY